MSKHGLFNFPCFNQALWCRILLTLALSAVSYEAISQALVLESMGIFYLGGEQVNSPYSDNRDSRFPTAGRSTVRNQAKITFLVPATVTGPRIILVPGFGLSSSIYLSTPDGREGWAQYFARHGHPVYVLDLPDRSSSGFMIDAVNGCISADLVYPCTQELMLGKTSLEQPWSVWGFGPEFGVSYPDSRFPALPLEENYIAQFGASFEIFTGSGSMSASQNGESTIKALELLTARIGPSVLLMHSAAGAPGFRFAQKNPEQVKALISIETVACPRIGDKESDSLAHIPFLAFYGDHVEERSAGNHSGRRASCKAAAEAIARTTTPAKFIDLPGELKIYGNSHLMMQDNNNKDLADLIIHWLNAEGIM